MFKRRARVSPGRTANPELESLSGAGIHFIIMWSEYEFDFDSERKRLAGLTDAELVSEGQACAAQVSHVRTLAARISWYKLLLCREQYLRRTA